MSEKNNYQELERLRQASTIDDIANICRISSSLAIEILDTLVGANNDINKNTGTDYIITPQGFNGLYYRFTSKGIKNLIDTIKYQEKKNKGNKEANILQDQYDELVRDGDISDFGDQTITQSAFKKLEFPGFQTKNESEQMITAWWQHIRGEQPKWFKSNSLYAKHMHDYMKYLETKKDN